MVSHSQMSGTKSNILSLYYYVCILLLFKIVGEILKEKYCLILTE